MSRRPFAIVDFPAATGERRTLRFENPIGVIVADAVGEVRPALAAVREAAERGAYAVGYVSYEAAPAFDPALAVHPVGRMPPLWFALFASPAARADAQAAGNAGRTADWMPNVDRAEFDRSIERIRSAIAAGETYQTNYTLRLRSRFEGDSVAWYHALRAAQGRGWFAYLDTGRHSVLSLSPELFFRRSGDSIVTRPMKGTHRRGRWPEEDAAHAARLAASEKDRAENIMIVDLLRNDLGRIAAFGQVGAVDLFSVERYRTVLQMTSTVEARLRPGVTLEEILAALFPSGSVTGAPKVATMRLITRLEPAPREVYCGTVGMIEPGGVECAFNVAIRTVWMDRATGEVEYGVGAGITWDSTPGGEFDELAAKAALLGEAWPPFDLVETMRVDDGVIARRDRHLRRVLGSARYFDIPAARETVAGALDDAAAAAPAGSWRLRLVVAPDGSARVERQALPVTEMDGGTAPVALAAAPVSRADRFLFHKTTHRALYDAHRAMHPDAFDVLLWNEEGEATEFTIGNLVAELDGARVTPPRDAGLLAGVFREELLERGEIAERAVLMTELERATRIWLVNSVREWIPVRLVPAHAPA